MLSYCALIVGIHKLPKKKENWQYDARQAFSKAQVMNRAVLKISTSC